MIFEEKLIFFPLRYPDGNWDPVIPEGYSLEDVYINSSGIKIHGWFIEPKFNKVKKVVLFCHGNAGNITTRLPKALAIAACGVSVLLFDYRAYGKSDLGVINESSVCADSLAAYNFLLEKGFQEKQIALHGISLGGAVACYLAGEKRPRVLSLESTFTSIPDMCKVVYPFIPRFIISTKFNNLERIAKLSLPIHIFHGTKDELIPFDMGRKLFEAAGSPKYFTPVKDAGHSDLLEKAGRLYEESLARFFDAHF